MTEKGTAEVDIELIDAYKHVFKEHGKDAQVDKVLADLAEFSGYYDVLDETLNPSKLNYARHEGRREIFARIMFLLGVSSGYREALRRVAMLQHEALTTRD